MAQHPDHDPLVSRISQPPLPGDDRDTYEDEIVGFPGGEDEPALLSEPGDSVTLRPTGDGEYEAIKHVKPKLEIRRNSTPDGETLTVAFRHRPPATSQTGTLIPGEIEAALTYYDPEAALQDACDFVTAALAAVRANVRRDA